MTFLYTATETFDKTTTLEIGRFCTGPSCNTEAIASWDSYIEWSKLTHLVEVVSLDGMLNATLVEPDYDKADDWNFIHTAGRYQTGLYTTLDYVLQRARPKDKYNVLAVIINPGQQCQGIQLDDFQFMGYDLLDEEFGNSALTNCGGFEETFLPIDLTTYGLIEDYLKAYDIRNRLAINNPQHPHAHTHVMAVWRHKTLGR